MTGVYRSFAEAVSAARLEECKGEGNGREIPVSMSWDFRDNDKDWINREVGECSRKVVEEPNKYKPKKLGGYGPVQGNDLNDSGKPSGGPVQFCVDLGLVDVRPVNNRPDLVVHGVNECDKERTRYECQEVCTKSLVSDGSTTKNEMVQTTIEAEETVVTEEQIVGCEDKLVNFTIELEERCKEKSSLTQARNGISVRAVRSHGMKTRNSKIVSADCELGKIITVGTTIGIDFSKVDDEVLAEVERREEEDNDIFAAISETKLRVWDSSVIRSLGGVTLTHGVGVEAEGTSGGLITLWNDDLFSVKACISNQRCIIMGRLDRFLFSSDFLLWFPNVRQLGLPRTLSDHNAILVGEEWEDWGPKPFHFFNGWLKDKGLIEEAVKGWNGCKSTGSKGFSLASKAKEAKKSMKCWIAVNKKVMGEGKFLENKLVELDSKAEVEGWGLKDSEREVLEVGFSEEEVWAAVCSYDGNKALGLDGLNLEFVKANWNDIQVDFMNFIYEFHRNRESVKDLNKTFVALIPKSTHPESMKDFRPISLVSSMYKILAKVLANHLKLVMGSLISESQSAFVKGRQILDSFVVVEEIIHSWRQDKVGVSVRKKGGEEFDWATLFKCKEAKLSILYLGMPLGARPSSQPFWNSVMSRIKNRLAPWKKKYLSKWGRLVLIKSVLGCLPTYFMSVFQIPVCVAKTIEKSQRSFFWDDGVEKRKLHVVDWVIICNSKKKGGIGVGRIVDFNRSLLAKWVWRFGRERNQLWKRVLCEKYGVKLDCICWNWSTSSKASPFVKAVDGLFAVEDIPLKIAFLRIFALSINKTRRINEFGYWEMEEWIWEVQLRRRLFGWELNIWNAFHSITRCVSDLLAWFFCPKGIFFVKSFRNCIENNREDNCSTLSKVWSSFCSPNSIGEVLCSFSTSVVSSEASAAELLAIHRACLLCASNTSLKGFSILIESDSKVAIEWVKQDDFGYLPMVQVIYDIRATLRRLGNLLVCFTQRESNSDVDALAKRGLDLDGEVINWLGR
ncbi:hypothetical protein Ddye_009197 [Dipteronia dyeriana]|uniref:RNase H type-1 domain-containing protein n=1 Tax=Dipteronia dyeriana TaxID=168575 RepID=A0AAD9XAX5_9ROSI|nr:hypothetical protein Ddye_009197 [Dipteronia dyeriana]